MPLPAAPRKKIPALDSIDPKPLAATFSRQNFFTDSF